MTIEFDDLIPKQKQSVEFDDLIPKAETGGFRGFVADVKKALTPKPESVMQGVQADPSTFDFNSASRMARALADGKSVPPPIRTSEMQQREVQEQIALDRREARRKFARENPVLGGLASGSANVLAGTINAPQTAAAFVNKTFVDPVLNLVGADPMPSPGLMPGTKFITQAGKDFSPRVGRQDMGEAWDNDQFGKWLMVNLAQQAPQISQSVLAALYPPLRATILPAMGAQAAGSAYVDGDDPRVAVTKGLIEAGTEMLPLGAFDRVAKALGSLPEAAQRTVLQTAGRKLLAAGGAVTANSATGAIEEAIAQFGGNVLDRYASGKNVGLMDKVPDAAVLGAAAGGVMSTPQVVGELLPEPKERVPTAADYQAAVDRVFNRTPAPFEVPAAPPAQAAMPAPAVTPQAVRAVQDTISRIMGDPVVPQQSQEAAAPDVQPVAAQAAPEQDDAAADDAIGELVARLQEAADAQPASQPLPAATVQAREAVPALTPAAPPAPTPAPVPVAPPAAAPAPAQAVTGTQAAVAAADAMARYGRDGIDIAEGGQPFKTRAAASKARKLQPMMRVVSHPGGGYVLAMKTPGQLAAQEKAAKRLRQASVGKKGQPLAAHEFIASEGGLRQDVRSDLGIEGNPRIGNRTLYAGAGKGLTLEQATEKLLEAGYISDDSHNTTLDLIRRSLTQAPQYTAEGFERQAEAELEAQYEDHLRAQQEAAQADDFDPFTDLAELGFTEEDGDAGGYWQASPDIQAEVRALAARLDDMGGDSEGLFEDLARQYPDLSQQEFYETARQAITDAIAQLEAAQQGGRGNPGQDDGSQARQDSEQDPDQGLSPDQVALTAARIRRREDPRSFDSRVDEVRQQEVYLRGIARDNPQQAAEIARALRANPAKFSDISGASPDTIGRYARIIEDQLKLAQPEQQQAPAGDGITIIPGKGLIKGKFLVEVDGEGVPGGPFDTELQAREAALQRRQVMAERAKGQERDTQRKQAIADKLRNGQDITQVELDFLGLKPTSDLRWFIPAAADLFGITSRQVRPLIKSLIRPSFSDMGAQYEVVQSLPALRAIGAAQGGELTSYTPADIEQRLDKLEQAEKDRQAADREAERRARADAQRDEFTLIGSDRPADRAAARGQRDLMDEAQDDGAEDDGFVLQDIPREPTAAPDDGKRVLRREPGNLLPAEKRAFDEFMATREDAERIMRQLDAHKGTPWAKQAVEGIFTRQAMRMLLDGRTPDFQSSMDSGQVARTRRVLSERGLDGLWQLIEADGGLMGAAAKPVNNVNSSFVNCDPSADCAKYCYATRGNYQYANVIVKSELVTLAVELDPVRAAQRVAQEYKATAEFVNNKALRLFDKGDGNMAWLPFIKELNRQGIRTQIFSKVPEFLRQVPDMNLRLLSIDNSNMEMADQNQDLPVAFVYTGKDQIDALATMAARNQIQVVLPVKLGQKLLDDSQISDLKAAVPAVKPYLCPIDAGFKPLGKTSQPGTWNCTKCDVNGGVGCFHGQATKAIMQSLEARPSTQQERGQRILELRRELNAILGANDQAVAQAGRGAPRRTEGLLREVDSLLGELLRDYEQAGQGQAAGQPGRGTDATGGRTGGPVPGRRVIPIRAADARAADDQGNLQDLSKTARPMAQLNWEMATDDSMVADLGNGWTANIYMEEDGTAELAILDPRGVDFGDPINYDSVNTARDAAAGVIARRISQEGVQAGEGPSVGVTTAGSNTLQDISGLQRDGGMMGRLPEAVRANTLARLKALQRRLDDGRLDQAGFIAEVQALMRQIEDRNQTQAERSMSKGRERGPEWVKERLMRAKRKGELDADTVDFALWALEKNPALATDLGISLPAESKAGAAGDYNPAARVMRLFKQSANTGTAVHEILHHTERMMPPAIQAGIQREWAKAWAKAYEKASPKQREALNAMLQANAGDKAAYKAMREAFANGTLNYDQHYQLVNASEFWAVNATDILGKRYEARGSWIMQATQWLREMLQKVRGLLGLRSDAPVLKGLQAVLDGNGQRMSPAMLSSLADTLPQMAADTVMVDGVRRPTTDSEGRRLHPSDQGVKNFWRWYSGSDEQQRPPQGPGAVAAEPAAGRADDERGNRNVNPLQRRAGLGADAGASAFVDGQQVVFEGSTGPVGEGGRPLVVYHGTRDDIQAFDLNHPNRKDRGWLGRGVYASSSRERAELYADQKRGDGAPNVMPVYMAVRNPYMATEQDKARLMKASQQTIDNFTQALKDQGYDGVVMPTPEGDIELVAFDATQVKSAIGNDGSFDADDPSTVSDIPNKSQAGLDLQDTSREPFKMGDIVSFDRDAANRRVWRAGRKGFEAGARFAKRYLGALRLADTKPGEFRELMRRYQADNFNAQQRALEVAKAGQDIPKELRALLSDIIEKEVAVGDNTPEGLADLAASISGAFEQQAQQLIELGMLSEKRLIQNYLPRVYRNPLIGKLQSKEQVLSWFTKARMRIRGDRLKRRGLVYEVEPGRVKDLERLGWRLSSMPDGKDIPQALRQAIEKGEPLPRGFSPTQKVVVWRDFTKTEREQMGEVRDAFIRFAMGYVEMQKDIAIGRLFKSIAENDRMASAFNPGGWVKVPKKEIPDSGGVQMYGALAGMYVERQVADQLKRAIQDRSAVMMAFDKALALWKEGKTVWNPVAHGNNIVSNVFMGHFAGLNMADPRTWREAVREYRTKGAYYQEAVENGLLGTEFANTEIQQALMPELREFMTEADVVASRVSKMAEFLKRVPGRPITWYRENMQKAYEFEDQLFKLMVYIDRRKAGATPGKAIDEAERYFFNYADVPEGIRTVQRFWSPFFSYTYKAIPSVLHTAATRPDRILLPMALLGGANWLAYAILGADADEEEERKGLPDYLKGRTALGTQKVVRLPVNSPDGNPYFLDMSRRIPLGDIFDVDNQLGGMPWAQPFMPAHPFMWSLPLALFANKDPFTGREIARESDTGWEAAGKRGSYLYKQIVPNAPFVPGSYSFDKTLQATARTFDTDIMGYTGFSSQGDPARPGIAALDVTGVAKVRESNTERNLQFKRLDIKKQMDEVKQNMMQLQRRLNNNAITQDAYDRERERQANKMELLREKLEEAR